MGKASTEGAKGSCLALLMADAGWYGKVTGLCAEPQIPNYVLPRAPERQNALHAYRPF